MQLNKILFVGLLCTNIAYADVAVVEEFSSDKSIHTAKVISKEPIFHEIMQTVVKPVCRNRVFSRHYDRKGIIEVVYRENMQCRNEYVEDVMKVFRGYSITYEYNGKYFSAVLDHDPGEYVSVHSGK